MLIRLNGVNNLLICIPGGKRNAWSEALCSLLYME